MSTSLANIAASKNRNWWTVVSFWLYGTPSLIEMGMEWDHEIQFKAFTILFRVTFSLYNESIFQNLSMSCISPTLK
ncbi:hypothetical protein VNO77_17493 [Canavalia gladiata]|uniref:Uncharacterized protein n=1 Tax=Canavalia gladiata TaxID=3824 RepID=A0AAN9LMI0_CANGL